MGRAIFVMGMLLMLSAISLVTARYQSRHLYIQNEQLDSQASALDVQWRQYQLERAELSRNARVDQIARETLRMVPIVPSKTLYLTLSAESAATQQSGGVQ
ncbi:cell division protein FtsL [Orrella sp. 11846]|uniref:cell division protein FtsL n=1 Tax=Orrella sp. 11846 TaxID=3409913 RepID=UPI003B592303